MTLRFDSFLILSLVNDWMSILLPLPLSEVKPSDFRVFTHLHTMRRSEHSWRVQGQLTYRSACGATSSIRIIFS